MTIDEHEGIKNYVTKLLNYYGFDVQPEWKLPNNRRIDLVARYSNDIFIGVEIELTGNLRDDVDRLTSIDLSHRFVITESKLNNITSGGSFIEVFSSSNLLPFEERIREIINAGDKPRFKEIEIPIEDSSNCRALTDAFESIIQKAGFDKRKIRDIVYLEEITSGKGFLGKNDSNRKEYNFLTSLGVWDWDYILSRDKSKWIPTRDCIVNQKLVDHSEEIKDVLQSHTAQFNYIVLVGTLGHIRYGNFGQGMVISLIENFGNYSDLLSTPLNEQYWLGKVCEIEVKKTIEYYQEWVDIGIGIKTNTEMYLPLVRMLKEKIIDISPGTFSKKALYFFSLWMLLRDMVTDYKRLRGGIQREENYKPLIEETARMGYTSEILPEPSKELFAIYDNNKFSQYCENKIIEYAQEVLGSH